MKPTTPPPPGFAHLLQPTCLSPGTLRSLEKHLRAIYLAVQKEIKANPAKKHELDPAYRHVSAAWLDVHKVLHHREVAAAVKRDKGVELWTVFKPTRHGYQEITRTPNRKITYYWWKNHGDTGHHKTDANEEQCTEVMKGPVGYTLNNPWGWDLRRAMEPEAL